MQYYKDGKYKNTKKKYVEFMEKNQSFFDKMSK